MHVIPFQKFSKGTAKMAFLGDLMGESLALNSIINGDPFYYLKDFFSRANYVVGNLETTFSGKTTDYPRFSTNDLYAEYLAGHVNLLFTANNHTNDYGSDGIVRTIEVLEDFGLDHIGTSKPGQLRRIQDVNIEGHEVSFINYTQFLNGTEKDTKNIYKAADAPRETAELVSFYNETAAQETIDLAKKRSEFVVVAIHCADRICDAKELSRKSTGDQRRFLRSLIDMGADLVIGGHPHYFQGGEILDSGRAVIYSLGNFYSTMHNPPQYTTNCGCVLIVTMDSFENITYSFLPVATVLNQRDGLLYVIPMSPLEGGAYSWVEENLRVELLKELSRIRETLQKCNLSEERGFINFF